MAGLLFLYRIALQSELLSLLSIKDLMPLLCRVLPTLNPPSVPLIKGEVTEEKANNPFAMDSATSTRTVPSKDVAGIISWLSFVLLVIREFSMTKVANRFAVSHRSFLLLLEDQVVTTIAEDLVEAVVENEDEERVKVEEEVELTLSSMSPFSIMTILTMRSFRIIQL